MLRGLHGLAPDSLNQHDVIIITVIIVIIESKQSAAKSSCRVQQKTTGTPSSIKFYTHTLQQESREFITSSADQLLRLYSAFARFTLHSRHCKFISRNSVVSIVGKNKPIVEMERKQGDKFMEIIEVAIVYTGTKR